MRTNAVRDQIMETASRLFYTQGYNNTGINQIIEEAGIAKASLYQHFSSKEELLIEYLELAGLRMTDMFQAATEAHVSPADKVIAIFDLLDQLVQRKTYNGCRFLNIISEISMENERVRDQVKAQKDSLRNLFAEILKPVRKESLADELYLLVEAVFISSKIYGQAWPVETAKRMVQKLM